MFGEAGDYDGIRYVLEEMKSAGVEPNLVVYNTLLEAMGKAGKPGVARSLFDKMLSVGLTPNEKTLTVLAKIYGNAKWSRDALELWEKMTANRWPMDFILYNTLLSMCADVGLESEAEKLFADMKASESLLLSPRSSRHGLSHKSTGVFCCNITNCWGSKAKAHTSLRDQGNPISFNQDTTEISETF